MLTFDDVRREDHETYYFCNASYLKEIRYFLDKAGITDYKILKYGQLRTLPPKVEIPMVPSCIYCEPNMRANAVIIFHFNLENFHHKIEELFDSPEMADYEAERQKFLAKESEQYAWTDGVIYVQEE